MSKARAKGTKGEVELLPLLKRLFGDQVERAPLRGIADHGDYTGVPFLCEKKNTTAPRFQQWARVCEKKDVDWAIFWNGDRRKGAGHGPYVLMPQHLFVRLVEGTIPPSELTWDFLDEELRQHLAAEEEIYAERYPS